MGADFNNPNDQFLVSELRGRFHTRGLRVLLLDWITFHNLPFEIVNTERFQRILLYGNPLLEKAFIPSAKTLLRMLTSEYEGAVGPVTEVLRRARSQVHFTFDGWTSKTCTSFIGINAQFLDRDFVQHRILLGLRPLRGRHSGTSLAEEVADTLAFWQVDERDKIGYFTLDNAANNNTCMNDLAFEYDFSPDERRIRCATHIFNLCVRAMLYGSKGVNFAAFISADGDDEDDDDQIDQVIDEAVEDVGGENDCLLDVDDPDDDFVSSHPAPKVLDATSFREYGQSGVPGNVASYRRPTSG